MPTCRSSLLSIIGLLASVSLVTLAAATPDPVLIEDGFESLEGPAWIQATGSLVFSDQSAGIEYVWQPGAGIVDQRDLGGKVNGHGVDPVGRLIACESANGQITRREADGSYAVLADGFEGTSFNGVNDVAINPVDGSIWFTDPYWGPDATRLASQFVYRIDPVTAAISKAFTTSWDKPNGLGFAPDGSRFYLNSNGTNEVFAFDLDADGMPVSETPEILADGLDKWPDGMAVHPESGELFVCLFSKGSGPATPDEQGVNRFLPDGTAGDMIPVPGTTTNAVFTDDGSVLFITSGSGLYRIDFDGQAPSATIEPLAAVAGRPRVAITFSEPVYGFSAADLTVAEGQVHALTGGPQRYEVLLERDDDAGTLSVGLPADVAFDAAGTGNLATAAVDILATHRRSIETRVVRGGSALATRVTVTPVGGGALSSQAADHRFGELDPATGHALAFVTLQGRAPELSLIGPRRLRVYAPVDEIIVRGGASDAEDGDLAASVEWSLGDGPVIGTGIPLQLNAGETPFGVGFHQLVMRVVDADGIEDRLEFPILVEDVASRGTNSVLDGHDERVLIDVTSAASKVLDLSEYAVIPDSDGMAPRCNGVTLGPDGRLWVNDMRGLLYDISDGSSPELYLDLAAEIGADFLDDSGQVGFGYVAFHPEFASNGRFYTVHSEAAGDVEPDFPLLVDVDRAGRPVSVSHHEVLTEWTADDPSATAFSGSRREVLRVAEPYGDRNMGQCAFDPTLVPGDPGYGLLYVAIADGGNSFPHHYTDPLDSGQDTTTVLGTVIRIDPTPDGERGYSIPADNPFIGDPTVLDEIWAYGLRNPHRLTWDPDTGAMFISDIGQDNVEEVNLGRAGANYGWSIREGSYAHPDDSVRRTGGVEYPFRDWRKYRSYVVPLPEPELITLDHPVIEYDHNGSPAGTQGRAVMEAEPYRGSISELAGHLITGDSPQGFIFSTSLVGLAPGGQATLTQWEVAIDGSVVDFRDLVDPAGMRADIRVGRDADGELYFTNKKNGIIYRLEAIIDRTTVGG